MIELFKVWARARDHMSLRPILSSDSSIFCLVLKNPPFRIQEEGWGEFDMTIGLGAPDKEHNITHDLNFQQNRYESKHVIVRHLPLKRSTGLSFGLLLFGLGRG